MFTCEERNYGTLVQSMFSRPDGSLVEVVVQSTETGFRVTDLGETTRWLDTLGLTLPSQDAIEELLEPGGVSLVHGELQLQRRENLALHVVAVVQACVLVSFAGQLPPPLPMAF